MKEQCYVALETCGKLFLLFFMKHPLARVPAKEKLELGLMSRRWSQCQQELTTTNQGSSWPVNFLRSNYRRRVSSSLKKNIYNIWNIHYLKIICYGKCKRTSTWDEKRTPSEKSSLLRAGFSRFSASLMKACKSKHLNIDQSNRKTSIYQLQEMVTRYSTSL